MIDRIRIALVLCLFALVLASAPSVDATAATYTVTVIGPFSRQGLEAVAMNNRGHVTGEGAGSQLFLYDGSLHLLGKPAGSTFAAGQGISDRDVIAATVGINGRRTAYAVTYAHGHATWTQLPNLPGYPGAQVSGILPDGSAISGTVCRILPAKRRWCRLQCPLEGEHHSHASRHAARHQCRRRNLGLAREPLDVPP